MVDGKTYLQHNSDYHAIMEEMKNKPEYFPETFRDIFLLGMVYAIKNNLEPTDIPDGKKQSSIRIPEVINDDHRFMFQVIAYWKTGKIESIIDENFYFSIAEKYANTGIKEIIDKVYKSDNPSFTLAELALE